MEITRANYDSYFPCPFHQQVFLAEMIPEVTSNENLSFTIVEDHQPLAIVPLFRSKKWGVHYGKMSSIYCIGPSFSSGEFSLKKKIRIAQFCRTALAEQMDAHALLWIQYRQNVFAQPPFKSLELGHMVAEFSNTDYSLVVDVGNLEVAFSRMESKSRRSIRRAMGEDTRVEHRILDSDADAALVSMLQDRVYESKGYRVQEGRNLRHWQLLAKVPGTYLFTAMSQRDTVLAFAVIHRWEQYGYYSAGGILRDEEDSIGAANLLHWEVMKFLSQGGGRWYDMSRSMLICKNEDKRNVAEFKRSLGAEPYPYIRGLITRGLLLNRLGLGV